MLIEVEGLLDGWITCNFTTFLTVLQSSGRWMGGNERLCAMESRVLL